MDAAILSGGVASATLSGRECDCPEWVERCCHFGGQNVHLHHYLVDNWFVCWNFIEDTCGSPRDMYDDQPSALAAFYEAEAKLLERE